MATNLWENADFESGITGYVNWGGGVVSQSTEQAWHGTNSLKCISAATSQGTYNGIECEVSGSTQYTFSFYVYTTATMQLKSDLWDQAVGNVTQIANAEVTSESWQRVSATFTTGAGVRGMSWSIKQDTSNVNGIFYIDGIMLETGTPASAWVDSTVSVDITPSVLTTALQMYSPTVINSEIGLWDIGAYIYTGAETGVTINPPLLQTTIQIHDPVVYAVDVPTAIEPNLMTTQITMFNPTVSNRKTSIFNRAARLLHVIMRG